MDRGSELPTAGEVVGGKYRIEQTLGVGGMGAVFQAAHVTTGKRFAIKWMLPDLAGHEEAVTRFIREAQIAGRFQHPNVVEVYDIGQEGNSFYMVLELLEGESLASRLRLGRMSAMEACRILLPCMRGVASAHAVGIVHRDLKPANIFLCRQTRELPERPKVLDFGISKISTLGNESAAANSVTKTGAVIGTPHYMSPEQVRGVDVDHRTDVYAFGVILYELLSGKLPFQANTYGALVLQIVLETPEPLQKLAPELAPGMIKIVNQAMARNSAERFQSLEEMAQKLEPYAAGHTPPPEPSPYASVLSASSPQQRRVSQRPDPLRAPVPEVSVATPLSSEFEFDAEFTQRRSSSGLMWTAISVGVALVVGGGFVAMRMAGSRAGHDVPARTTAAGHEEPAEVKPKAERAEPKPNEAETPPQPPPTVVVVPAAQQGADGWQTPPEAAQPKPNAAEIEREAERERARARAEAEAAAAREREAERERTAASRTGSRHPRNRRGQADGEPPAPPEQSTPAKQPADPNHKPTGRLGVSLDETDF